MSSPVRVRYYGWSALSIESAHGALFFDPFWRHYCGVQWFNQADFSHAKYVCVTHGHEEHFLDVPPLLRATQAQAFGSPSTVGFLKWRGGGIAASRLHALEPGASTAVPGYTISAFLWKHRDINLWKALSKAVFQGNATQLSWAFSSATRAPFYSPYTGFHVAVEGGLTVMNYNEGFNSKMTDAEIGALGRQLPTDVLLGGMQLDFVADLARGAAALNPRLVLLYPPHEYFHKMMGVTSRPWSEFVEAVQRAVPNATVLALTPGDEVDLATGALTRFDRLAQAA
jgi:L-ascorbate metabolism protein UlaG (beta-lactamase superfamily)